MIYLQLFLTFLQIGAISFGGGYGMISLINEKVMMHGWLTQEEFLNVIAISESTPGPIAVNMATFIGSSQGGVSGALIATVGVVLPSFIIIILIAKLLSGKILKYKCTQAILSGIRPCVIGVILATAFTLLLNTLISFEKVGDTPIIDVNGIIIFSVIAVVAIVLKLIRKKNVSPIVLIIISAGLGIILN